MVIPTVYRALLTSAVSGIGHRIHTAKKNGFSTYCIQLWQRILHWCATRIKFRTHDHTYVYKYVNSKACHVQLLQQPGHGLQHLTIHCNSDH